MKNIYFLLNSITEFTFLDTIKKYLPNVIIDIGECLPKHLNDYDLIILWNYRKIVPITSKNNNIIVFHASDLPEGRGWATIYNAIIRLKKYYIISGLLVNNKIDEGNIVVKAKFEIKDNHTAKYLRMWDTEISIMLIKEILTKFNKKTIQGIKQKGQATYYERRTPKDNEISLDSTIEQKINHLRACEEQHPAYIIYNNIKYTVNIEPVEKPEFPDDLKITFYDK